MTDRHKDFTSSGRRQKQPVTFTLEGEDFTAAASVPGAVILDFIADADSGDGGRAANALIGFIEDVIIDEDKERFGALIRDPEKDVEIETLASVCEWLVGEYSSRPTKESEPSSTTLKKSGSGSTARSRAKV